MRARSVPLRVRLVAGFVAVMVVVLTAAGGFVYWRVRYALDRSLTGALQTQADDLRAALARTPGDPGAALAALGPDPVLDQVLDASGAVLATTPAAPSAPVLRGADVAGALRGQVRVDHGNLLLDGSRRLRVLAFPLPGPAPRVALTAVRLAQRDEALRELLLQLTLANLAALALASLVGYRLTRAALDPVERYRSRAEQVTAGTPGVRLDVPLGADDEISRLGHTLNAMLSAQERAAERQRRFLADASHELRSPLALLSGEVELALRRPRTAPELEQTLRDVAEDTARLVALADRLLALEQAGAPAPDGPADGWADAAAALARARRRAEQRLAGGARAVVADAPEGPVAVAAPDGRLDQVLGNLVDNAVDHGAGDVALRLRATPRAVVLAVHDDGRVPAGFVPHAVERFRRSDEARTSRGTGLGLSVVHALVGGLGGELRMCTGGGHHRFPPLLLDAPCSHPADGTTVSALLPSADPARAS